MYSSAYSANTRRVEFVQIALNYLDWEHASVQARRCYETIRRHGKQVVVMEAVKGGTLASLPEDIESLLREANPERTSVDWSLLFDASLDGVLTVLSGMSDVRQVEQNVRCLKDFAPRSPAGSSSCSGAPPPCSTQR